MTETTDIAALSSKIVHQLMDLGSADDGVEERALEFVSDVLSKIVDKERQLANESGERFYKAVQYGAKLEAEIAALKGEQVPVGKFAGWGLYRADTDSFGNWLKDNPREETDHAIAKNGYVNVRLFTAPQKPVVLLPVAEDYPIAWSAASVLADVKAAIEAAGGNVKHEI